MRTNEEQCPGCGAVVTVSAGAAHRYIGAAPACWQLYTEILGSARNTALLIDAYAVQHHGDDSAQAVQSVGIHLMTLHGILQRGMAVERALWIRRRALRQKGVFTRLAPPPVGLALTIHDAADLDVYVRSVSDVWHGKHGITIATWFDRHVVSDTR